MSSADDYKNQGNDALKEGKDEEAIRLYTLGLQINPNHHVLLSNRAAVYLKLNKYELALKDATLCIEQQPAFSKGFLRRGQALYALKRYEESLETLEEGLKVEPNNAQIKSVITEVKNLLRQNGPTVDENAASQLLPLLKVFNDPKMFGKIENHPELAKHLQEKDYVDALKEIQASPENLQKHISDPRIMSTIIFLMQVNPEMEEKMRAERGKKEDDDRLRRKEEERKKKEDEQKKLDEVNLQPAMVEKNLGNEYYKKKDFEKALEHYDKAITLDPTNMILYLNKAAVYMEQGDFDTCIKQAEEAIQVGKTNHADFKEIAKGYARIGNAYFRQQNYSQALHYYTESLTEHRNPEVIKKKQECEKTMRKLEEEGYINPEIATQHKNAGNQHFKDKKFPEAMKEYNEAIKRNPKDATIFSNRAACYIKLGEFAYGLRDAEKAIEIDPNFVKAYIRKAQCHVACKEYHKALATYDQASKVDPNNEEIKNGVSHVMDIIQHGSGERDEQRIQNAMKDPEIAGILQDPIMQTVLRDFQNDPNAAQKHLKNPDIFGKIQKLIASGIIQTK